MRILIVNDDGIHAKGIEALARMAAQLGEVWIVAPDRQCSGMSQKLTIFEKMPVREEPFPVPVRGAWSVGGTPADCVKLALNCLLDERPDYIFSGVNDGCNAGFDICYSGTIGACFEAVLNGIPAIAFSCMSHSSLEIAEAHMRPIAEELIALGLAPGEIWNVNFPAGDTGAVRGILHERRIAPMQMYDAVYTRNADEHGLVHYTQQGVIIAPDKAPEGTDIAAVLNGYISIGKIKCALMQSPPYKMH